MGVIIQKPQDIMTVRPYKHKGRCYEIYQQEHNTAKILQDSLHDIYIIPYKSIKLCRISCKC